MYLDLIKYILDQTAEITSVSRVEYEHDKTLHIVAYILSSSILKLIIYLPSKSKVLCSAGKMENSGIGDGILRFGVGGYNCGITLAR